MTVKIFISYPQEDFFARGVKVKNYLSKLVPDSDVYIDQDKSKGQEYQKYNDKKLEESDIVIVILTPAALASEEVSREVSIAKKMKKRILPCKDDSLDMEWNEIPWGLSYLEGIIFEEDEVLKTRLYREIKKIVKELGGRWSVAVPVHEDLRRKDKLKQYYIPLIYNKRQFNLPYFVTKGEVSYLSAKIDDDALSVVVEIGCKDETEIGITLPRKLIDAKLGSKDDSFFVIVDGEDTKVKEEIKNDERTVNLILEKGEHTVEIIGNQLLGISIAVVTLPKKDIEILPGSSIPTSKQYLDPEILRIKQGESVSWVNNDAAAHTITSGTPEKGPDGMFDSSLLVSGGKYKITFNKKGTYDYFCMFHPWKVGKIIVE